MSYVSIQGHILKQFDGYFLLSVVVVLCGPDGEDRETWPRISLNCHHNLTMEVAAAG